ncbi:MAG: HD domain-containing protein [Phycisphaerales bacterium]|nr:MAG: HD domain-containing protein [Phycisphaerales bacterium]
MPKKQSPKPARPTAAAPTPTPAKSAKPDPARKISLVQQAISFAQRRHRHQTRRDGNTPYAAHVVRVAFTIERVFDHHDEATIAAALLHDTIEDTHTDFEDLAEPFGQDVAGLVAALTKNMALPEIDRERAYDLQLARADWRARLIKLADAYDNLCDTETLPDGQADAKRLKDAFDRAHRAITLAETDARTHDTSQRAIDALTALIDAKLKAKAKKKPAK